MNRRIAAVAVLALAGVIAVDRFAPAAQPRARSLALHPNGGVLACPVLTVSGARSAISIANVGTERAHGIVTIVSRRGPKTSSPFTLAPGATLRRAISARTEPGTGAIIEYAGSRIVAAHSFVSAAGGGAAPCRDAGASDVVVGGGTTVGGDTSLALVDPGAAPADVTVTIRSGGRTITPERLTDLLVPARARRDIRLGDYIFGQPDVVAIVHANSGRIVAEGLVTHRGQASITSSGDPMSSGVILVPSMRGVAFMDVTVDGTNSPAISTRLITASLQTTFAGLPATLDPGTARTSTIALGSGGAAVYVSTTSGSPIAGTGIWSAVTRYGSARATVPLLAPSTSCAAVAAPPTPTATGYRVMLANPGTAPAMITMIVNGSSARTMSVSAGRLVTVGLPRSSGVAGVSVRSDQPISAALTGITVRGKVLAPVVFSVPCAQLTTPSPVAVTIDPRTGVAAPFAR